MTANCTNILSGLGLGLFLVLVGLPNRASAQVVFYGVDTSNDLYTIDPYTQATSLIGNTGASLVEGLAIAPDGWLYATDASGNLISINPSTGVGTLVGSTGKGDIEGLDFMGGTLVGISTGATPTIFSINLSNASTTDLITLQPPGFSNDVARAMAVFDSNTVFISTYSLSSQADLYLANISTGAVTYVGFMAVNVGQFLSMDIGYDGNLFGFDNSGGVWLINQSTAAVTLQGTISGFPFWLDVTTAAIPEPSTNALLLFGAGVLWLVRRRVDRVETGKY